MRRLLLLLAIPVVATATLPQKSKEDSPPPPIVSPEVHPDQSVTFRLRAPNAKEVSVSIEGSGKPLPMQKDDRGVWNVTSDPLAPDYYGYSFTVDGVGGLLDPANYRTKPNFLYRANEVHIPGPSSLPW